MALHVPHVSIGCIHTILPSWPGHHKSLQITTSKCQNISIWLSSWIRNGPTWEKCQRTKFTSKLRWFDSLMKMQRYKNRKCVKKWWVFCWRNPSNLRRAKHIRTLIAPHSAKPNVYYCVLTKVWNVVDEVYDGKWCAEESRVLNHFDVFGLVQWIPRIKSKLFRIASNRQTAIN